MAYQKKNTTATEKNVTEETTEKTVIKKKKFEQEELIPCISITPGKLYVDGYKSKNMYTFADMDDVVEIEFRDLDYLARTKDVMMFKPRYIVQDKDFIALHPTLDEVYSSLYSTSDLREVIDMTPAQMKKIIPTLPIGAQDALKTIAATMVDDGTLDSIKRVQVLDEIFGTQMFLKLNM